MEKLSNDSIEAGNVTANDGLGYDDPHPAAFARLVGGYEGGGAQTRCCYRSGQNSLVDHIVADCIGSSVRQLLIKFVGTGRVGMPFRVQFEGRIGGDDTVTVPPGPSTHITLLALVLFRSGKA